MAVATGGLHRLLAERTVAVLRPSTANSSATASGSSPPSTASLFGAASVSSSVLGGTAGALFGGRGCGGGGGGGGAQPVRCTRLDAPIVRMDAGGVDASSLGGMMEDAIAAGSVGSGGGGGSMETDDSFTSPSHGGAMPASPHTSRLIRDGAMPLAILSPSPLSPTTAMDHSSRTRVGSGGLGLGPGSGASYGGGSGASSSGLGLFTSSAAFGTRTSGASSLGTRMLSRDLSISTCSDDVPSTSPTLADEPDDAYRFLFTRGACGSRGGGHVSLISDGVLVGDRESVLDPAVLLAHGVHVIVNCASRDVVLPADVIAAARLKHVYEVDLPDAEEVELFDMPRLRATVEYVAQARRDGATVLVVCQMGMNRSVTVVLAYMLLHCGATLLDAASLMRARRPVAYPRVGSWRALMALEMEMRGAQTIPLSALHFHRSGRFV